ncbi:MAG: hypothetical protein GY822_29915 [Deltaproteobacteria bacterium]|nr:hypothetical protein [Deltaproteobacteria bacterium]
MKTFTSRSTFVLAALCLFAFTACPAPSDVDAGQNNDADAGHEDAGQSTTQDAGSSSDAGVGVQVGESCDFATFVPSCDGDEVTHRFVCDEISGQVAIDDCGTRFDGNNNGTICGVIGCINDGDDTCAKNGAVCMGQEDGSLCAIRNRFTTGTPCSDGFGCIFERTDSGFQERCRPTRTCIHPQYFSGCSDDIATFCVGDLEQTYTWEWAAGVDCASFNGTCTAYDTGSVCALAQGEACMTLDDTSVFHCAAGLVCEGQTFETPGVCQPE